MAGARNTLGQLEALHAFLEEVEAPGGWRSWPPPLRRRGDRQPPRSKSSSGTFWWGAMEQMAALLGETVRDLDGFTRLFRLLLSQYQVGTIPQTLDSVMVAACRHAAAGGPVSVSVGGSGGVPAPGGCRRYGPHGAGA